MAAQNVYDDLIMDHIKNARGYHVIDDASHRANGANPLCGDDLTVYVLLQDDRIEDASFQCTCCGISMASASMMTESIKGQRLSEIKAGLEEFSNALIARADPALYESGSIRHILLNTVHALPARVRCATLPWLTLRAALENQKEPVSIR